MASNIFSEFSGNFDYCSSPGTSNAGMKFEVLRLGSYLRKQVAASSIRLASAGFYATGNGDETKCYSCGATHKEWKSTDNPVLLHRQMSVDCRHIADIDTDSDSSSVEPRLTQITSGDNSQPVTDNRAVTRHFNAGVTGTTTMLAAPFGKGIADASANTTAFASAATSTSRLSVLADKGSTASDSVKNISGTGNRGDGTTTVQIPLMFENAVYPHYSEVAERLKSFATWPKGHCKRPEDLVEVGFFYAGYSDCVRCYVCGVGLRTWEGEDDPWTEHVRWRSSCDYVAAIKGQDFAIRTLANLGRENRNANNNDTPNNSQAQENFDILKTDICSKALEMGFNSQQVRQTAMAITKAGGMTSLRLDVLIEKMMADEAAIPEASTTQTISSTHALQPLVTSDYMTESWTSGDEGDPNNHLVDHDHAGKATTIEMTGAKQKTFNQVEVQSKQGTPANSSSRARDVGAVSDPGHNSLPALSGSRNLDRENTTNIERKSRSLPCYSQTSDEDENRELKESSLCKVCLDEPANIVFLPCGHLVSCVTCSPALERCPLCRKHIRGTVRVYLANMKSVKEDP